MVYFYESTNKKDKLYHPITICAGSERRAFALCLLNFKKHNMIGSPKRIDV